MPASKPTSRPATPATAGVASLAETHDLDAGEFRCSDCHDVKPVRCLANFAIDTDGQASGDVHDAIRCRDCAN